MRTETVDNPIVVCFASRPRAIIVNSIRIFTLLLTGLLVKYERTEAVFLDGGDGGGGSYSTNVRVLSTGEMASKKIIIEEEGIKYRFTPQTVFDFEFLRELEWTIPEIRIIEDTSALDVYDIKKVVSLLPEGDFKLRQPKLRGDAVMKLARNGVATVILKEQTSEVIKELIHDIQNIKGNMALIEKTIAEQKELDKKISETREDIANLSGFVYGIIAVLGIGLVSALFGYAYKRIRKST